jgi:hypothetical protein
VLQLRGVVVDEEGRPLAGAEVRLMPFTDREIVAKTGPDGAYSLSVMKALTGRTWILARSDDGRLIGSFDYDIYPGDADVEAPARIVAKPAREVDVHVVDSAGKPVAGATVDAAGGLTALAAATTIADGEARIALPVDRRVQWIVARKSAVGCDYAEYGPLNSLGQGPGVFPGELPPSVTLTLGEPRTVRIKALDEDGAPLADFPLYLWLLKKDGRLSDVNYGRRMRANTGPDGVAVFDWLPSDSEDQLIFWPGDAGFAHRRVEVEPGQAEVVARLVRTAAIRGRVTLPDGSPARGVMVLARGSSIGRDDSQFTSFTAADGSYEMLVPPDEEAYAVHVEDPNWAAPARLDIAFPRGRLLAPVDFRLTRGTELKGRVTQGQDHRPASGNYVTVSQDGRERSDDLLPREDWLRRTGWSRHVKLDEQGRYATRLAPGKYFVSSPGRKYGVTIEVADQPELNQDFHMPTLLP